MTSVYATRVFIAYIGVGKTSFVLQYLHKAFDPKITSEYGQPAWEETDLVLDGINIKLQVSANNNYSCMGT